ncbi:MAG: hypothetical protein AB7F51_05415, partial [Pseudorhodoplanes sp.]
GGYNLAAGNVTDSIVTHVSIPFNSDIRKAILMQTADLLNGGSDLATIATAYSAEPPKAGRSLAEVWKRNIGVPRE